ncbi:MAG: aminoacetone oxidase family FAD-binding enzyme, partial [Candidatus Pacebacteria bacterium]|nr:aminoacetone oxidase family FAD-binding enzyme [Candidatus Paceibacterota bacterium]
NGPFLFHAFSEFGPAAVREFFEGLGVKTVTEAKLRVFPKSGQAGDVLGALLADMKKAGVEIMFGDAATGFETKTGLIKSVRLASEKTIEANNYIIATGGMSHPATGSTGDGYRFARELGHSVIELSPALVPVRIVQDWPKKLAGVGLKRSGFTITQNGKKIVSRNGECLFTHFGLSGPVILDLSAAIAKLLAKGPVKIVLDMFPEIDRDSLERIILDEFKKFLNRALRNCLAGLVPQGLAAELCLLASVNAEKTVNDVTREERHRIVEVLKKIELDVEGVLDIEAGMVTDGGVDIREIDGKTMRSAKIKNLFFAGEVINVHGQTGGFNLQQCWSTGRLAGVSAAKMKYE